MFCRALNLCRIRPTIAKKLYIIKSMRSPYNILNNLINFQHFMYKISVVGIDNCGKTSVVRSLAQVQDVSSIHLTAYQNNGSRVARISGRIVHELAQFGEAHKSKSVTGLAYLSHLFPYFFEQRAKNSSKVLISDRDPIVDTLCYSDFYLPDGFSRIVRPPLKLLLESSFDHPNLFCYLDVSPEVSAQRNNSPLQLHEDIRYLNRLKELFEAEMFLAKKQGITIAEIETDDQPLEEVVSAVRFHVNKLL